VIPRPHALTGVIHRALTRATPPAGI